MIGESPAQRYNVSLPPEIAEAARINRHCQVRSNDDN